MPGTMFDLSGKRIDRPGVEAGNKRRQANGEEQAATSDSIGVGEDYKYASTQHGCQTDGYRPDQTELLFCHASDLPVAVASPRRGQGTAC
mgnify:CR=1 FL=1